MTGDYHARFCESLGGKFPGATRPIFKGTFKSIVRSISLDPDLAYKSAAGSGSSTATDWDGVTDYGIIAVIIGMAIGVALLFAKE